MTTAIDIITRSFQELGVLGVGEVPDSDQASIGLVYLNDLLQSMSNEELLVYGETKQSLTLTGASYYTVGTGGTFNVARPNSISSAFFRLNNVDYPVNVVTMEEFDSISDKTVTGSIPGCIYYQASYPLGKLYVYPLVTGGTLYVNTIEPLTSLALLTTSISMPNGYEAYLRLALADALMTWSGKDKPKISADAMRLKAGLKRVNHRPRVMGVDTPTRLDRYSYKIERGY